MKIVSVAAVPCDKYGGVGLQNRIAGDYIFALCDCWTEAVLISDLIFGRQARVVSFVLTHGSGLLRRSLWSIDGQWPKVT